ncbi:MAG: hypothetical protein AAGB11_08015 [Pseudomonadota bacterium]
MRALLILALALLMSVNAAAQAEDEGRFQIERVGEGLLRLDRITGEVQLCVRATPTFGCRTVVDAEAPVIPDEPASGTLLAENEALKAENRALRERLRMIAALVEDAALTRSPLSSTTFGTTKREIDEAVEVTDYAVRRFRDLLKSFGDESVR